MNVLLEQFKITRSYTTQICQPLAIEDYVVQPCAEVSPPKWHLAHTTWFFEDMILAKYQPNFSRFNETYSLLFNSYYKGVGAHWNQSERGHLSRPTVREILDYRAYIDHHILAFLQTPSINPEIYSLLEIGIHHEQQHQELLLMDIKMILGVNPQQPHYSQTLLPKAVSTTVDWLDFKEDIYTLGHNRSCFAYDNEQPQHKLLISAFSLCSHTVTNAKYLKFIEAGGYTTPQYWLSQGWDWIQQYQIAAPLYWTIQQNLWHEYTLHGLQRLNPNAPVTHISYFEADAFAKWANCRLPTEQESEVFLQQNANEALSTDLSILHPYRTDSMTGQVWWWTQSHYSPYPGYQAFTGALEEYNGKFMCNQFVLKGGCIATPTQHYRHSYRNFYQPQQRWMFSGIRLAKDSI